MKLNRQLYHASFFRATNIVNEGGTGLQRGDASIAKRRFTVLI
jgi:hypothetical protein